MTLAILEPPAIFDEQGNARRRSLGRRHDMKEARSSKDLTRLALDLSWSWNHSADEIWKHLEPELWELTGNPFLILQSLSERQLEKRIGSASRATIERLLAEMRERNAAPAWFQTAHAGSPLRAVAYFSMEYMLSEALPVYSGGLGNVAGDQLKAASDLGVPVVGIGLLYQQGYFRQELGSDGSQQALYPVNEPGQLPIRPVRSPDGERLRKALERVRKELRTLLLNSPETPPRIWVSEVRELDAGYSGPRPRRGFTFYTGEETAADDVKPLN